VLVLAFDVGAGDVLVSVGVDRAVGQQHWQAMGGWEDPDEGWGSTAA
jgi:hypothetical protein